MLPPPSFQIPDTERLRPARRHLLQRVHCQPSACVKSETSARVKDCWWGARARLDPPSRTRILFHATDLSSTVPSYHGAVLPSSLPGCSTLPVDCAVRPFPERHYIRCTPRLLRSTTLTYKNEYSWLRSSVSVCENIPLFVCGNKVVNAFRADESFVCAKRVRLCRHQLPWKRFHKRPSKCPRLSDCDQHDPAFSKSASQSQRLRQE